MKLKEKIEENLTLSIMALVIVAFGLGWTAYGTILKAGNNEIVTANELAKLKESDTQLKKLSEEKAGKSAAAQSKQKVKVVFVDAMQRIYFKQNPEQYPEGNADFLIHHIEMNSEMGKLIAPVKKLAHRIMPGANPQLYRLTAEEVEKEEPDIVVIHRSAFYKENEEDLNDERLIQFLKGMKRSDTVFLLYSRKAKTDGPYVYELANKTSLEGRIFPYQFRLGSPFDDRTQVDPFFQTLLMLVHARMNQKAQSQSN